MVNSKSKKSAFSRRHLVSNGVDRKERGVWSTFGRGAFGISLLIMVIWQITMIKNPIEYTYSGLEQQFNKDIAVEVVSKNDENLNKSPSPTTETKAEAEVEIIDNKSSENERNARQEVHKALHRSVPSIGDHESILTSLLPSLLREDGMVPEGMIFDVGAQHGEQAAHYAVTSPSRQVLAMDPSPRNVEGIRKKYGKLPNLRVEQGGVGKTVGMVKPRDSSFQMDLDEEFKVHTLDSLFYDKGEKLGLLHLDVEGLELDVLKGGLKTIRAYKPIMTTEVRVHKDPEFTKELLGLLDREGYDTYVINEVCGYPHLDYRNILNIPRALSVKFGDSDTANLLFASEAIARVTVAEGWSIFEAVYPCCALGGECCPGDDIDAKSCCSEGLVMGWLNKNNVVKPPSMTGWKNARIAFEKKTMALETKAES